MQRRVCNMYDWTWRESVNRLENGHSDGTAIYVGIIFLFSGRCCACEIVLVFPMGVKRACMHVYVHISPVLAKCYCLPHQTSVKRCEPPIRQTKRWADKKSQSKREKERRFVKSWLEFIIFIILFVYIILYFFSDAKWP